LGDQQQYHNGVVPSLIVCYIVCYSSSRRAALQRKAQHIPLSSGLKGGSPGCLPVQYIAFLAGNAKRVAPNMAPSENAQELLRMCLQSIHHLSRPYFYRISGDESVPGTLSFLLGVKESDLIAMFLLCGFYHEKRGIYLRTVFKMWVAATFKTGTVKVTIYKKEHYIKIGYGELPKRPADQAKEKIDPPRFRMMTADDQGKSSKDGLMLLFAERSAHQLHTTTETTASAPATPEATTATSASPVKSLWQKFDFSSPEKRKLAMELVSEMDTPQKATLMRELVKGSKISIECHNNTSKKFVHIPQCSNLSSAMSQNVKYKFVQEIVNTLGAGTEKVVDNLHNGALWLCRVLADLYKQEFTQSAARAGVVSISRMSPKGTAAMWTDAKLTKSKSRKISSHLLDWFKQPITAKESDVDAFAGKQHVFYGWLMAGWVHKDK
jgi:hypothetical protein